MSTDNSLTIIYSKGGHKFEIYVDREKYPEFLKGHKTFEEISLGNVIFNETKGKLSEEAYVSIFGTADELTIMKTIAKNGEPQYTVQQRRKLVEEKKKQIVEYITKTYIDPKTNLPHPASRIENGMSTIKGLKIDLNQSVIKQGDEIAKELKSKILLVKNETHGKLYIDLAFSGKVIPVLSKWCSIRSSDYTATEYVAEVSFSTTTMVSFMNDLTRVTNGAFRFESDTPVTSPSTPDSSKQTKGKKGKKGKK